MNRYTCPRERLPEVETALAAEGYVVEAELRRAVGATRITVLTHTDMVIVLHDDLAQEDATIDLYLPQEAHEPAILAQLPYLIRMPFRSPFRTNRTTRPGITASGGHTQAIGESS